MQGLRATGETSVARGPLFAVYVAFNAVTALVRHEA
jgi:hypothetical protein